MRVSTCSSVGGGGDGGGRVDERKNLPSHHHSMKVTMEYYSVHLPLTHNISLAAEH